MVTLLSLHLETPRLVADKPCDACGNLHPPGPSEEQPVVTEVIRDEITHHASLCGLLTFHFVPGKTPLYEARGWNIVDGKAVMYGSLTFIRDRRKVFELRHGAQFEFSGGTIITWSRTNIDPNDVLSVFVHPEERCIWKTRWNMEEILAANNLP